MKLEDSIVVRITGGLGNQLFGLAVGIEMSTALGCELVLDARGYSSQEPRKFELSNLGYECLRTGDEQKSSLNLIGRLMKIRNLGLNAFVEKSFNYDPSINQIRPGTYLQGYFQSPKYFQNSEDKLRSIIQNEAQKSLDQVVPGTNKYISMHVRRGDYLLPAAQEFHGLASQKYFLRASRLMNSLVPGAGYRIFTDSPDSLIAKDYVVSGEAKIVGEKDWSAWRTINEMSQGDGFILSNSSFSWWAAWLMNFAKPIPAIAPRPWFASGESAADLLLEDWLTLDAR